MVERSGNYPIDTRQSEIARLRMQAEAMAFDAGVMLDRIGVKRGWQCLDLACGCGGIVDLLSARVGPTGSVTGLDFDDALLAVAREWADERGLGNVDWVRDDAYRTQLPAGIFDLVHMRFILSTAGNADELLSEAARLTKPGGVIAAQEPDIETLHCYPPHPAWDRLRNLLELVFGRVGNIRMAQHLFRQFHALGLARVAYRPFLVGFTNQDPMADYLPQTLLSLKTTLVDNDGIDPNEIDDTVAALRTHMAKPDTISTSYLVAQVWGIKNGEGVR